MRNTDKAKETGLSQEKEILS